jgi:hypothetical protein
MAHTKKKSSDERGILSKERHTKALELRKSGHSYAVIGKAMGVSAQRAHAMVMKELAEINETLAEAREATRQMELERLDRMLAALEQGITDGESDAITTALRISAQRCKLLGLDAPAKVEVNDTTPRFILPENAATEGTDLAPTP